MKRVVIKFISLCVLACLAIGIPATAQAQVRRYISFENRCNSPVRIYISHADGWRNWHPHGPFIMEARQGPIRLEANRITLTQTENHDLYFYAEALDGSGDVWEGNDHVATYNGVTYRMRRATVTVTGGWLNASLICR